jgi:hypothetical protein
MSEDVCWWLDRDPRPEEGQGDELEAWRQVAVRSGENARFWLERYHRERHLNRALCRVVGFLILAAFLAGWLLAR